MVAVRQPTKTAARPQRRPAPARRERLRVVGPDERVRSVGALSSIVCALVFATLLAVAVLHAVLVQTQARVDAIRAENRELEDALDARVAHEAWLDSPAGVRDVAAAAGLVEATDVVALAPVAPDVLAPPASVDPFRAGVAG